MRHAGSYTAFVEPDRGRGPVAHSTVRMSAALPMIVHLVGNLCRQDDGRAREKGLTLTGRLDTRGLAAEMIFRYQYDHASGIAEEQSADAVVLPADLGIPIPTQTIPLARPHGMDLWVTMEGASAPSGGTARYVGHGDDEVLALDQYLPVQATLEASFTPHEVGNRRTTRVEIVSKLRFERDASIGIELREPGNSEGRAHASESHPAVLIPGGSEIPLITQRVIGTVGPNPWIIARIVEVKGRAVHHERLLGRSMQLQ